MVPPYFGWLHPLFDGARLMAEELVNGEFQIAGNYPEIGTYQGTLNLQTPALVAYPLPMLLTLAENLPTALRSNLSPGQQELWAPLAFAFQPLARQGLRFEPLHWTLRLDAGIFLPVGDCSLKSSPGDFHLVASQPDSKTWKLTITTDVPLRLKAKTPVGQIPLEDITLRWSVPARRFDDRRPKALSVEIAK
jgi:hypothetical protein